MGGTVTHPGQGNPEIVEPAGPVDPTVGVIGGVGCGGSEQAAGLRGELRVPCDDESGRDLGELHLLPGEGDSGLLRARTRWSCFCRGLRGTSRRWTIGARYENPNGEQWAQLVGGKVGAEALKVLLTMARGELSPVASRTKVWEVERRRPAAGASGRKRSRWCEGDKAKVDAAEWTFAKETVMLDALLQKEPAVEVEVQAVQVGPAVFVSDPAEYFCQYGLEIKQGSGFPLTFPVSLANGCVGYVPTEEAFGPGGGGYETRLTSYSNLKMTAGNGDAGRGDRLARELVPGQAPERSPHGPFAGKAWSYGDVGPQRE